LGCKGIKKFLFQEYQDTVWELYCLCYWSSWFWSIR